MPIIPIEQRRIPIELWALLQVHFRDDYLKGLESRSAPTEQHCELTEHYCNQQGIQWPWVGYTKLVLIGEWCSREFPRYELRGDDPPAPPEMSLAAKRFIQATADQMQADAITAPLRRQLQLLESEVVNLRAYKQRAEALIKQTNESSLADALREIQRRSIEALGGDPDAF